MLRTDPRDLEWLAGRLNLTFVRSFSGGEFGAALVTDEQGDERVLKAMNGADWAPRFERGAALSERLRTSGYPSPRYFGTGAIDTTSWSLQERLPGGVPAQMTEPHAEQLLDLLTLHVDAAPHPGDPRSRMTHGLAESLERVAAHPLTRELASELSSALASGFLDDLRTGDIVHADFHHRNFLAQGEEVTGVFDWELAYGGDWRIDLVRLACWSSWDSGHSTPAAGEIVRRAAVEACEPRVLAGISAFHSLDALAFFLEQDRTEAVEFVAGGMNRFTRPWFGG